MSRSLSNELPHLALLTLALLCSKAALGAGCETPVAVHFERGSSAADLHGATPAGMPDCFVIEAHSGQRMTVTATSPDHAAVFQIYSPPFRYTLNDHGVEVQSSALPGAEEGRDVSTWSGSLDVSGAYLIVVNRTRGGGEYRLHIKIR
jgi:hypothetical protein